ncbi:hypothetical protein K502DRAFT_341667 [Neoconidiobolus thromboides FSU 785]|nr:hypothetical protein K502DRAFT_341667 [Neoconidiobolus thromboides FSU 785]
MDDFNWEVSDDEWEEMMESQVTKKIKVDNLEVTENNAKKEEPKAQNNEILKEEEDNEEEEEEVWEEIEDLPNPNKILDNKELINNLENKIQQESNQPLTITINLPQIYTKNIKKRANYQLNKQQKEKLILIHRAYLTTYINFGLYLNSFHYDNYLKAILLSHLDPNLLIKFPITNKDTLEYTLSCIKLIGNWWDYKFKIINGCSLCDQKEKSNIKSDLYQSSMTLKGCECNKNILLIIIFKLIGFQTRIITEMMIPIIYFPFATEDENTIDKQIELIKFNKYQLWGELLLPFNQNWIPFKDFEYFNIKGENENYTNYNKLKNHKKYYLNYTIGFSDTTIDLTNKYVNDFLSKHIKLRQRFLSTDNHRNWLKDYLSTLISSGFEEEWETLSKKQEVKNLINEKMPTNLKGFKNHPLVVLQRYIPKNQIIKPNSKHIGLFKGEKIYNKKDLSLVKNQMGWKLLGKEIIEKYKKENDNGNILYPEYQTKLIQLEDIKDQDICILKNSFGNFELFQPNMLPKDMSYLNQKYIDKVAQQNNIQYLRAVTEFKFTNNKMNPVINGIVIKNKDLELLLSKYQLYMNKVKQMEFKLRFNKGVNNWKKIFKFLNLKYRLLNEYTK